LIVWLSQFDAHGLYTWGWLTLHCTLFWPMPNFISGVGHAMPMQENSRNVELWNRLRHILLSACLRHVRCAKRLTMAWIIQAG
jgi:hypothetical protein